MPSLNILPDARPRHQKRGYSYRGMWWIAIACCNCGCDGGSVPEGQYSFYLCPKCAETYGDIPGHWKLPEEAFGALVVDALLDRYGHLPTEQELALQLDSSDSLVNVLTRSRAALTPGA